MKSQNCLPRKFKNVSRGFTLIELLVVIIIVGVLASVAIPALLLQIAKGRETEAKNTLGTLGRAQQTYHYREKEFYNGSNLQSLLDLTFGNIEYYQVNSDPAATNLQALHSAVVINPLQFPGMRDYALGVYFDQATSRYEQIICVSDTRPSLGPTIPPVVSSTNARNCVGGRSIN